MSLDRDALSQSGKNEAPAGKLIQMSTLELTDSFRITCKRGKVLFCSRV